MKKKLGALLVSVMLMGTLGTGVANAAYLSDQDKYLEVSADKARAVADAMGLKGIPLGDQTAKMSFDLQEKLIAQYEAITGKEYDHYYIWLTVNGQVVLAIDPPTALY